MMVKHTAAESGRHPLEVCYDLLLDVEGEHAGVLWHPLFGYSTSVCLSLCLSLSVSLCLCLP